MTITKMLSWLSKTTLETILTDLQQAITQVETDQERVEIITTANLVRRELRGKQARDDHPFGRDT